MQSSSGEQLRGVWLPQPAVKTLQDMKPAVCLHLRAATCTVNDLHPQRLMLLSVKVAQLLVLSYMCGATVLQPAITAQGQRACCLGGCAGQPAAQPAETGP
jgi:hypothetical protein